MVVSREKQRFLKTHPPASPTRSFFLSAAKQEDLLQPVRLRRLCSIPFQRRRVVAAITAAFMCRFRNQRPTPPAAPHSVAAAWPSVNKNKANERLQTSYTHNQSTPKKRQIGKKKKTSRPTILEPVPPFQSSTNLSRVLTKLFSSVTPFPSPHRLRGRSSLAWRGRPTTTTATH